MVRRPFALILAAALALAGPLVAPLPAGARTGAPAAAPDRASMVADRFTLSGNDTLTAEGAVTIFYQGARLTAPRIVYNGKSGLLTIEGPITLVDGSGTVLIADAAELSRDLTEGILSSVRMILDDQLQIAAAEMRRGGDGGRYTEMNRAVASSCQVCPQNPTPLWEIRADRVVHDRDLRQIYFDSAQFRVAGLPIFYVPRLRMPDPTLDRATGFLMPRIRTSTELGFGIEAPYFITLGDSRDLTLKPYLTTERSRTLGFRYREAFRTGGIEVNGAVTQDRLTPDPLRGYLFADGHFTLPEDFRLDFTLQKATDRAYLLDYGITDSDRLTSGVSISRTRRDEYIGLGAYSYESLRSGDVNPLLPNTVADATLIRRFSPAYLGGEGRFSFDLHGYRRASTVRTDANGDGMVDGRDAARATAAVDWRRNWILANGMVAAIGAELDADFYAIAQDAGYPGTVARLTPYGMAELRWPWSRAGQGGATQVIEPVAQLVWSPDSGKPAPNEDSRTVAFDEGNLFAFSRFPGADERERGTRLNLGVGWTRYDPGGWTLGVLAGRVIRQKDLGQFRAGSGLDGAQSDWLLVTHLDSGTGLQVINRAIFDDAFSFSRDEFLLGYDRGRLDLSAGYTWLVADPSEGRNFASSEMIFGGGLDFARNWHATLSGRYDFEAERTTRAGLGLNWRNECAEVDLSLSRRFTSSTSVRPSTDFSLSVALYGFGTGQDGRRYRRACGG
ncbi:MAG: LPS-assembly protein LptD [Defluviimonas sp.]|uniref:LPS-assembly protein LptD n=1 Tax=Albidovulum sp. TaxID=1872424 RepID=UPI001D5E4D90|nr:LPS-assembly protein LptD [Paracoccaceae bacterium]MCC0063995.1 LPS-assembly protein LptD [Defluviimonas sp.]